MADGGNFLSGIGSALSGIGTGLGNVLSNPLAQAALGTYFGAIGTPRWEGLGGAISRGGLAGLQTFGQARQAQFEQPILQQAAQQARAAMAPLTKEQSDQLDRVTASTVITNPFTGETTPDPEGRAHIAQLVSMYRGKLIDANAFTQALGHYDESKRMSNMANAQSKLMMASIWPQLAKQFGINLGPTGAAPQTPQMAAQPVQPQPAPSMAPSGKASSTQYTPQVMTNLRTWIRAARQALDGSYQFQGDDNQWYQMNPDGTQGPPIRP